MTSTPPTPPSGPRTPGRTLTSRTSLLTAAAVAGVLLAGTAAVAANIGILNAADDSTLGDLAATDELLPSAPASPPTTVATVEMVETTAPASTVVETTLPTGVAQQYDIEEAGSVWIMTTTSGLALDHVVAVPGWSPLLSQGDLRSLRVDFSNGDRTIVFTASLGSDGAVVVDVTEPSTVFAQPPAAGATQSPIGASPTTTSSSGDDHDEYEYEDDDHDEYEDDHEYEDDEYEDDDHDEYEDDHEYEGADDDD